MKKEVRKSTVEITGEHPSLTVGHVKTLPKKVAEALVKSGMAKFVDSNESKEEKPKAKITVIDPDKPKKEKSKATK